MIHLVLEQQCVCLKTRKVQLNHARYNQQHLEKVGKSTLYEIDDQLLLLFLFFE